MKHWRAPRLHRPDRAGLIAALLLTACAVGTVLVLAYGWR